MTQIERLLTLERGRGSLGLFDQKIDNSGPEVDFDLAFISRSLFYGAPIMMVFHMIFRINKSVKLADEV